MKLSIDIDCTPEEARTFLGLPHIAPLQEKMMKEMEERMQENIRNLDPETFMKTRMPATIQGWQEMQKAFWDAATGGKKRGGQGKKRKKGSR